ncbi:Fe-S cluster assembly sulfur transfer protein SufU [Bacillus songklensis]|uniref:Fe-S cluster assembly sulfur transfer protein SufU n=1 Tax=Bacillus songklensis TaxID=1069116 RepID=A0ABV8B747_9BACI
MKKFLPNDNCSKTHKNPTCGDVMTLSVNLEQDQVRRVTFLGEGWSISMVSASMMTELIKNKSLKEITSLRKGFEQLIRHGKIPDEMDLGDSLSLQRVHQLKARITLIDYLLYKSKMRCYSSHNQCNKAKIRLQFIKSTLSRLSHKSLINGKS